MSTGSADGVILTSADTAAIQEILSVLAQPLNYAQSRDWMAEASVRLQRLLRADKVLALLALPNGSPPLLTGLGDEVEQAIKQWLETFYPYDYELEKVRAARGGSVYHRDIVWKNPEELNRTLLYREWMAPNGLCDLTGIALDAPDGTLLGVLHAYHTRERRLDDPEESGAFGRRGLTIMRLLTPVFQAAVRFEQTSWTQTRSTLEFIDRLAEPAFVIAEDGTLLHANPRGSMLLADPTCGSEMKRGAVSQGLRLLSTAQGRWDIERTKLPQPGALGRTSPKWCGSVLLLGHRQVALMLLKEPPRTPTNPARLATALGLTVRQAQIALWVSEGLGTRAIATAGSMSVATVRRHIEAIFVRLGCRSRPELVARVLSSTL